MTTAHKTHYTLHTWIEGAHGNRTDPVEVRVHISRTCENCASFIRVASDDWDLSDGPCMDGIVDAGGVIVCSEHQTGPERQAGIYRRDRPVFAVVAGGAAC